jgi:hypothetical protein
MPLCAIALLAGAGISLSLCALLLTSLITSTIACGDGASGLKSEQIREHQSIKPTLIEFLHDEILLSDRITIPNTSL